MSTVATVTIMLILMTTIIVAASSISNNTKRINFASEIKSIQQAVNSYVIKNEGEYPTINSIVVDISELDSTYQSQFTANGESVVGGKIILNEIDYSKIGITDLKYGTGKRGANDIYAVSNQTGKVYYVMGLKIGNYAYYTLTTDLAKLLKLNDNQIDDTDPVVIFTPNKIEWTNQEIKVSIKIPKIFSLVQIKVNNSVVDITDPIEEGSYNVYNISNSGNYSIVVTYRKSQDDVDNSYAKYNVTNFDNTAPTFTLSEAKKMEGGNLSSYVDITNKVETGSGLKKIKYEYNGIFNVTVTDSDKKFVKAHFENNGIELDTKANVIPIVKGTRKLTVYMEDNAGNWSMQTLEFTENTESPDDYVKNGLILHLDGINNTGNGHSSISTVWSDLSGNNNGILKSFNNTQDSGWLDNCLLFDGIDDYVDLGNLNYNNLTVEIVMKFKTLPTGGNGYFLLIGNFQAAGYGIEYVTANKYPVFKVYSNENKDYVSIGANQIFEANKMYSISGSFSGKTLSISTNGAILSKDLNGTIKSSPTHVFIGANPNISNLPEEGKMVNFYVYSVRIYNRVLMEEEILNNYNVDKARFGI